MKNIREIKIGIVAAAALFLLFWGINFLKGKKIFSSHTSFYTVLDETRGLTSSKPVTLNGIRIGRVNRVYFHPDGSGRVMVRASIENRKLSIPKNSVAMVRKPSLVGEIEVAIQLGDSSKAMQGGDTLMSVYVPSITDDLSEQIFPLAEKVKNLIVQIDSVFGSVNKLLDAKNIQSMARTLENLSVTTQSLANNSGRIDGIMTSGEQIMGELRKSSNEVSGAVKNFATISNQLAEANLGKTLENASKSIQSFNTLLEKIHSSEGSLNLLLEDKELYNQIKRSTLQLELLLKDLRENPKRYINFSIF